MEKLSISELFNTNMFPLLGPAEFDPEKISLTSATGPASDISAGSSNSFEQNFIKNNLTASSTAGIGAGKDGKDKVNPIYYIPIQDFFDTVEGPEFLKYCKAILIS